MASYLALFVGAVGAWWWGRYRTGWQLGVLWSAVAFLLLLRWAGALVRDLYALQPIHALTFVSAMAGTLGPRPSPRRIATAVGVLWGLSVLLGTFVLHPWPPPPFPEGLWDGPVWTLDFMFDLRWFGIAFGLRFS